GWDASDCAMAPSHSLGYGEGGLIHVRASERSAMKPLQYSIFTFTIAAIFALGPVAGIVLIPNSWWGLAIKGVLFFILIGAVGNFLRPSPARERVYGGSAPGFVLIMPL